MANPKSEIRNPKLSDALVSLAFWLALFTAAGMYALVALSPKLLTYLEQRSRWRDNQERLVQAEREVEYLKRVEQALENDPQYSAELARVELDASRPGEERIPVSDDLVLVAGAGNRPFSKASLPWYADTVRRFSEQRELRNWTLLAAAVIIVLAFGLLHAAPPTPSAPSHQPS